MQKVSARGENIQCVCVCVCVCVEGLAIVGGSEEEKNIVCLFVRKRLKY